KVKIRQQETEILVAPVVLAHISRQQADMVEVRYPEEWGEKVWGADKYVSWPRLSWCINDSRH
ncbi:hypothetical protein ACTULD_004687, partial [Escherichia coli]